MINSFYFICLLFILGLKTQTHAQEIIFTPHWIVQSQFAGFYVADSLGYYKEEGLNVKITHPSIAKNAFHHLKDKSSNIISSNLSQALVFNSSGADLVNIMQLSQKNSLMLVSRFPLKDLNSLRNKKIAVWNYIDQKLLDLINRKFGIDVQWVRFNGGINVFLSGAVDIMLITKFNEYYLLKQSGVSIPPEHTLELPAYGYDLPEDGVYVKRIYYLNNKEALQKFVKASKRGWEWANENRKETVGIVMDRAKKNNVAANRYHQSKMLDVILELQLHPKDEIRDYHLREEDYKRTLRFMQVSQEGGALNYYDFVK